MLNPIPISVVSYINTWPFLYGILNHPEASKYFKPVLDYPSAGVKKLLNNEISIGLLPVGGLVAPNNFRIITNYCIGAEKKVETVKLFSNQPIEAIERILLDYQSTTSVLLTKILMHFHWGKKVEFVPLQSDNDISKIAPNEALLLIGDRCLLMKNTFRFSYDLAEEWHTLTQLPFAFAVWVAQPNVPPDYTKILNDAITLGIQNIDSSIYFFYNNKHHNFQTIKNYLTQNIQFEFTPERRKALELYLDYYKQLSKKN
ncbi:MAG TPA: menaquinone biosynthesis protein [Salinivirgaceae bacterium]|nr:menaquinone biosynthesis protein [Salinivirgaceae bacterium]